MTLVQGGIALGMIQTLVGSPALGTLERAARE